MIFNKQKLLLGFESRLLNAVSVVFGILQTASLPMHRTEAPSTVGSFELRLTLVHSQSENLDTVGCWFLMGLEL